MKVNIPVFVPTEFPGPDDPWVFTGIRWEPQDPNKRIRFDIVEVEVPDDTPLDYEHIAPYLDAQVND